MASLNIQYIDVPSLISFLHPTFVISNKEKSMKDGKNRAVTLFAHYTWLLINHFFYIRKGDFFHHTSVNFQLILVTKKTIDRIFRKIYLEILFPESIIENVHLNLRRIINELCMYYVSYNRLVFFNYLCIKPRFQ